MPAQNRPALIGVPRIGTPVTPAAGRKAVFLGDSITHGSNAAAGRRWVDQVPKILGSGLISSSQSIEAGVPGQTSAQILARYNTDVRGNGAQVLFLLAGTNDAAFVPLSTFAQNIKTIAELCKRDGIPLIVGLVPPRGASSINTTNRTLGAQYNLWLRMWAPTAGVRIAETHDTLCQTGADAMVGGYDSGDGVHPETVAHQRIAEAFAAAYLSNPFSPVAPHLSTVADPFNMNTNPSFTSGMTPWYEQTGGTGTAPTYATAADVTGALAYGNWQVATFDATASGGVRYRCLNFASGFSPGDKLLITAHLGFTDVAGGFYAAASGPAPTAAFNLRVFNQSFVARQDLVNAAVKPPGHVSGVYTVPAGDPAVTLVMQMILPTGQSAKFMIGEVGVYNITTLPDLLALV